MIADTISLSRKRRTNHMLFYYSLAVIETIDAASFATVEMTKHILLGVVSDGNFRLEYKRLKQVRNNVILSNIPEWSPKTYARTCIETAAILSF